MDQHHHRRAHRHHQRLKRDHSNRPITKVHYVTLEPTFNAPVAGYTTVQEAKTKKTTQSKTPVVTTKAPPVDKPKQTQKPNVSTTFTTSTKVLPPPSLPTTTSTRRASDSTVTSSQALSFTEKVTSSPASYTRDSAMTTSPRMQEPTSIPSTDRASGPSVGGLVAGCLVAFFLLIFISVFFYRKRKQRAKSNSYGETEDEKSAGLVSGAAATAGFSGGASLNEKADNVSLRTITQFDANLDPPAASPIVKTGPSGGPGRHAIPRKPIPPPLDSPSPPQPDVLPTTTSPIPNLPVIPTAQPSPTLSAFSGSFVSSSPVQGPVNASDLIAPGKPSPVHRVQMDYSSSQADELDIRIGQLVRMLHEYDDGWALCVRMDRLQQGVCPRTCLSDRPVKPRPNPSPGSPVNHQRRGQVATNSQEHLPDSQKYIPYSGSCPGTPSKQHHLQSMELSKAQPVPQITVSRVESNFSGAKDQQETRDTSNSVGPDAPTFHAM